jgi:uncharacterized membrane protein YdbT with pleckstrin-like domain
MKIKNAAILLLIASICTFFVQLLWDISQWDYLAFGGNNGLYIPYMLSNLALPLALFVLSVALIKNKTLKNEQPLEEKLLSNISANNKADENVQLVQEKPSFNELVNNLTVGNWIVNFLISIIPLVGLIFTIIWANDEKNIIRKNWAIASLIWMGILFVLSIILYATIFATIMSRF